MPEPDHPWASIGYWGDHQVIYLCKLLELSKSHHPDRLPALLERELFTYANVPYKIRPYSEILNNVRDTIVFDFGGAGVENAGQLYEGWVQYSGIKPLHFRIGAFAPSLGLEDANSTSYMPFLDRPSPVARSMISKAPW